MATYSASAKCINCGWTGTATPTKGTAVNEATCPDCECVTLQKA